MTDDATGHPDVRPELIALDSAACERVRQQIAAKGGHCEACGATDFAVGHALIMGFLFLDEQADAYLVGLTCRNPECPKPRSAITLCGSDFLSEDQQELALSLRSSIA